MKVKLGIVGYGGFCKDFVRLFRKHPDVEEVCVAELVAERRAAVLEEYPDMKVYSSYEELLLQADINSVAVFTQRHLHGDMVIKALEAGKNVYSAVPIGCTVEEVKRIVELVRETKLVYMMGETCYYYPSAIYCREKYREGKFGKFVYAEAQYYHDVREMYKDFQRSGGESWRRVAGIPPMFYPTHSISMVFSAIDQYATQVSCMGLRDDYPDDIYGEEKNDFCNPFSNETALFRMSGGGVVRINEFRRVGINKPSTYITCFYGEDAAYDCVTDRHFYQTAPFTDRSGREHPQHVEEVSEELLPIDYMKLKRGEITELKGKTWVEDQSPVSVLTISGFTPNQDQSRLPKALREGYGNHAHFNSHPFLVDDFVRAVVENKLPPNNAWEAARYMIPGLMAHESALQGGKLLDIPDLGEPPAEFERLEYTKKYED